MKTTSIYRGITFEVFSQTEGEVRTHWHTVNFTLNGNERTYTSTTKKQCVDMFKKLVRKTQKHNEKN